MSQLDRVIMAARGFIGLTESPANSNNVIFNTRYYGREVSGAQFPWCVTFIWDVFRIAGCPNLFYGGGKTASSTELMMWAKRNGYLVSGAPREGDIVFYNWNGSESIAEHIGLVTGYSGGVMTTIEGNTSIGNDSNGGQVLERLRDTHYAIGLYRPEYKSSSDAPGGNEMLTYEEFLEYMARYATIAGSGDAHSAWADTAIRFVSERGIFSGGGDGDYGWQKPITREAAAQLIYNILTQE